MIFYRGNFQKNKSPDNIYSPENDVYYFESNKRFPDTNEVMIEREYFFENFTRFVENSFSRGKDFYFIENAESSVEKINPDKSRAKIKSTFCFFSKRCKFLIPKAKDAGKNCFEEFKNFVKDEIPNEV